MSERMAVLIEYDPEADAIYARVQQPQGTVRGDRIDEVSGAGLHPVQRAMVEAQGGDPDAPLPEASERRTITAPRSGYLMVLDARAVGISAWRLGAGRSRKWRQVFRF